MKKWNNPELVNLQLKSTKTESEDPYFITPILKICTGCGKWGVTEAERNQHEFIWTSPFTGYYPCNKDNTTPPSDDPTMGQS